MSIETYSLDLTLNIDEFNKNADAARKHIDDTFVSAVKSTEKFNQAFATLRKQWGLLKGDALKERIKDLQQMEGVSKEVAASLEGVYKAISGYSNGSDKQSIYDSFKAVQQASDTSFAALQQQQLEAEAALTQQVRERMNIEASASANAEAALTNRNKAINDGLLLLDSEKKSTTEIKDDLEDIANGFYRHKEVLSGVNAELEEAKSKLSTARKDAVSFFEKNNIAYDSKTGIGSFDDPSLTEGQVAKIQKYNEEIIECTQNVADLEAQSKSLEKSIKSIATTFTATVNQQEKEIEDLQKSVVSSFTNIKDSVAGLLTAIGTTKYYKEAIAAAGELEKSTQRLIHLFEDLGNEAMYSAQEIAESHGMSNKAASQTIGYVGNLMKAYGLTNKMSLELAEGITELSADLASFSGGTKTAEQAAQALSQALLGNYRATRDLGIAITDTEVKLMAKSLDMSTESLTQGELALLRYKVVQQQTVNVVDDFARSQNTYYVASQKATAAAEDLKAALGDDLLPVVTAAYNSFAGFTEIIGAVPSSLRTIIATTLILISTFAVLRTTLRPVLNSMTEFKLKIRELVKAETTLSASTGVLSKAMQTLKVALNAHPILFIGSLIATAATLFSAFHFKAQQEEIEATTLSLDGLTAAIRRYKDATAEGSTASLVTKDIASNELLENAKNVISQMQANNIKFKEAQEEYNKEIDKTARKFQELEGIYNRLNDLDPVARNTAAYMDYGKSFEQLSSDYQNLIDERTKAEQNFATKKEQYTASERDGVLLIAQAYMTNEEAVAKLLEGDSELAKKVNDIVESYKLLNEYGYKEEEILRAMNYEATGWSKEIKTAEEKLLKYQNKRLENEGEYRRAVLSSIDAIQQEKELRDKDIRGRALFEEQSLFDSLTGRSEDIKGIKDTLAELFDQVEETGDVSNIEVSLEHIEEDYGLEEGTLDRFKALLKLMGESYELSAKERAIAEEDYANKVYKINEKLETRLINLRSKAAQTLEEQRNSSLDKLSDTYKKYIDELYASKGGSKGILGDLATEEELAAFEDMMKQIKDGVLSFSTNGKEGGLYRAFFGDQAAGGKKAKEFFDLLLAYYNAYTEGRENIEKDYVKKVADIQAKHQQTMNTLNAALSKDREKIHQAELDNLEIEKERRIAAAESSGEKEADIEAEYALKRLQTEQEFNDETEEIRRESNRSYLELKKGLISGAKATYAIELELLDEELQYELAHVKETGKKEEDIRREFALKRIEIEREAEDAIRENRRNRVEDWGYGAVSQEGNFLGEGFASYYSMFTDFEDKFIDAKRDLQTQLADGWDKIMIKAKGTEWEDDLKKIENAFTTAATDEDLLGIRTLIDELKVANPKLAEAIEEIIPEDAWDKTEKRNKQRAQVLANIINQTITKAIDALGKLLTAMEDAQMEETKRRISQMKEAYDDMKEQMEKRNDKANGRLTRSQKDAIERQKKMDEEELERQKALIEDQETLLKEQETEQFERQKAFSIATATITGIQAAINAYTAGMEMAKYMGAGAVAAPAIAAGMMAASLAATTAQIAMIASQQAPSYAQGAYNLPQDQTGVNVHKGEMIIPRPFAETLRSELSGNTSDASSGDIVINVYGATDEVSVENNSSEGNQQLDIYLTQRVKTMVARGELDNALQTRYSISKNGRMS